MQPNDWIELILFVAALVVLSPGLGVYIAAVAEGHRHPLGIALKPLERGIYRLAGVKPDEGMGALSYGLAVFWFNLFGVILLVLLQRTQAILPGNPANLPAVPLDLAFNTAVSFVTNTNWQAYSGESTISYLVQMLGLGTQNFVSAATGMAVLVAVVRGLRNRESTDLGNFWVDLVRITLYVLIPLSLILAILLVSQGVVMTFQGPVRTIFDGVEQVIPLGPAASQIAIKQLGTNGGGFFGANSAHPFENPTGLSNFLQVLSILLLPGALVFTFGRMIKDSRQALAIFAAMLILFLVPLGLSLWSEYRANPALGLAAGQMLEGKEWRFGISSSVLWANATTVASNGSVNAMHDSLSPLAGAMSVFNILLGEIIFGGVGSGLYGMLVFVLLTVFIAGLMVGRSPEYLGKKVEAFEVKMAMVVVLAPAGTVLILSAMSAVLPEALSSLTNSGPHGLSEILYAFASAANNNGSAFAGLNANTLFFNLSTAFAMLVGRYAPLFSVLAIAGSLSRKRIVPASAGGFPTHTPLFVMLLIGVILIVGALTFFPALILGPGLEQLLLEAGRTL